ncbi:tRNA nucleotidyltransferase (CCA-adding enzyme) [Bacillus manliponensis]|uniref:tRNA nucleotidyltransferase (CCA-adding enzyme) n=1 Tax=Bacillus manliponensis TaxID=574376 RepID=A0A073JY62_9BACI|nr:CBASS oligonucleotide cyclase [Bacillus manliponensis]KEK19914.1 tRNA nucleotidyltransferase (CCA-adding enzyme) [Bacillus manliponensis]
MGGSNGGYSIPTKSLQELEAERIEREKQLNYEREVNEFLQSLFKDINNRNVEQVNKHLDTLKKALEKDSEDIYELKFGGSVSKHTYTNGLSDIDMLVRINKSSFINAKPEEVLSHFAKKIQERLPKTNVSVGKLAVTVKFSSGSEIQLLPSIKTATGYKIAKPGKNEWSNVIKPEKFATKLTKVNQANSGRVVPLIKLFKGINDTFPKNKRLSGYHIESLGIDAFKKYTGKNTYKGMTEHFCKHVQQAVLRPIKDSTGQSIHVDGYLGGSNSQERKQISHNFKMLGKRLSQANAMAATEKWKDILGY